MRIIWYGLFLLSTLHAELGVWTLAPEGSGGTERVRWLDARTVRFDAPGGIPFTELSDLAFDARSGLLYAVSDQGYLYTMELRMEDDRIADLQLRSAVPLREHSGEVLKGKRSDAEGLSLSPEGLLVSFERRPRIACFAFDGRERREHELPKPLRKKRAYLGSNKMLESVVWHPRYGVITAPEKPLAKAAAGRHTLYGEGREWQMAASGSLTALEVTPQGDLLVLEREIDWTMFRYSITLSLLKISDCPYGRCPGERVARLESSMGWHLDNFEGLTRVEGNRYLMVSDDNGSPFQRTLLVLFELPPF